MARKIMKLKKKQKTFFALPKMFSLKMMVDKICSTLSVKNKVDITSRFYFVRNSFFVATL